MLDFFRKYQRYFFLVITVVVIISFSFFGTYSAMGSNSWREQVAFKAINGREITRSDVDEMSLFLATDAEDKKLYGGVWGPNFLNDGVIRKDFFETGLAQELVMAYREDLQEDFDKRLVKEKKYQLYSHPQAPFLSVQNVWSYFAPQMSTYFESMKKAQNALDSESFDHRVQLFLAEKQVPASTIRYVLNYQEKQFDWLKPDDRLNQIDLSLFGYHSLEDWFGPRFTKLVSEFIINAAILAENQGYDVSKAEVLTDLVRNTQLSYQQNKNNPGLGVTSPEEYLSEQLRRLNMDQARAVKIWRQILLFRRYFHDAGANVLVDSYVNQKLQEFAQDSVTVDLYRLPSSLKIASFDDLQKLEMYLYAVTKQDRGDSLALPQQFLPLSDVLKKYPELVQKRYVLEVAQVNQKTLQARIGLRELWNWEVEDNNWASLIKEFPTLAVKSGQKREERFETLEGLDPTTRLKVDTFSKQAIVQSHPEWIHQSLNNAKSEKMVVGLRIQGGKMPFSGLDKKEHRVKFIRLLDEAPIGESVAKESPLFDYSADQQVYYRIAVLNRAESQEILAFSEAKGDGTLSEIGDRILEKYYVANREKDASLYQNDEKKWKSFKEVRDSVAEQYLQKVIKSLEPIHKSIAQDEPFTKERAAALRLYPHVKKIKEDLENNSQQDDKWVQAELKKEDELFNSLAERPPLHDQWKIEKKTVTLNRQNTNEKGLDMAEALALPHHEWSTLKPSFNGDLAFFQAQEREKTLTSHDSVSDQVKEIQTLLGDEAQRHLMSEVLSELKNKKAISLDYLKIPSDETLLPQEMEIEG